VDLDRLIEGAVKARATDLHLMEGFPPYVRIDDVILPVEAEPVTHVELTELLKRIMPERLRGGLETRRGVDFAYQHKELVRTRTVAFYERRRLALVFRLIPMTPPTLAELEMPPVLERFEEFHRGLVVLTGPTGCGKSTTLAALIHGINARRRVSIITIEDPIEYLHRNQRAVVVQREVGEDVASFQAGLIQALRQDPDVILVGEMRELETMRTAIQAAETGHLVLSTLHTASAIQTIERVLGTFPENEHGVVLEQLAANLRAVVTQELVRRKEGKGRIAAAEILVADEEVAKLIRERRFEDIYTLMKAGRGGMQTLDLALAKLIQAGKITEEEARRFARDVHTLHRYVTGKMASSDVGAVLQD